MADVHSQETRSYNMSRIRSKNTKPEIIVRKYLHKHGFRFRLHVRDMPGKPDIVLPKYKTVIYINGCFWHGHSKCKYSKLPATNYLFWHSKIESNKLRDLKNICQIKGLGWQVVTIFQCELKVTALEGTFNNLHCLLKNNLNGLTKKSS